MGVSRPNVIGRIAEAPPRVRARVAGLFYVLNVLTGGFAAGVASKLVAYSDAAILVASACFVLVTLLFYGLFKPVNRNISLIAALSSLVGCAVSALSVFHLAPYNLNSLPFFGLYCLLIGYLIFRSTFLPRILGVLMAFAGFGWLTFVSPSLAHTLSPYNMLPGVVAEGLLTLWLLVMGVNSQRWTDQAAASVPAPVRAPANGRQPSRT